MLLVPTMMKWKCNMLFLPLSRPAMPSAVQDRVQGVKSCSNIFSVSRTWKILPWLIQGVEKAYAIQAGRELRVIVEADKVTDGDSDKLSFEIAQKIQTEMTFPGQIKVTVIREKGL